MQQQPSRGVTLASQPQFYIQQPDVQPAGWLMDVRKLLLFHARICARISVVMVCGGDGGDADHDYDDDDDDDGDSSQRGEQWSVCRTGCFKSNTHNIDMCYTAVS